MIDLNVRALTELSLAFVDSLQRHRGGILNVGSVAGFLPGPGSAVYCATRPAALLPFTEALHSELKPRGIKVTVLCPGPVPSRSARAGVTEASAPGMLTQTAETVAEAGFNGLMRNKRIQWCRRLGNKLVTLAVRAVARRLLLLRMVDARQSRRRAAQKVQSYA